MPSSDFLPSWEGLRDNLWAALAVLAVTSGISWGLAHYKKAPTFWQWATFSTMESLIGLSAAAAVLRFGLQAAAWSIPALLIPVTVMLVWDRQLKRDGQRPQRADMPHPVVGVPQVERVESKPKETLITPTPAPAGPAVGLAPYSPRDVRQMFNSTKPFMRDDVVKHFIGIPVLCVGSFVSIIRRETSDSLGVILDCQDDFVFADDLPITPGIQLLDKGDILTISGPISGVTTTWINIKPSTLVSVEKKL